MPFVKIQPLLTAFKLLMLHLKVNQYYIKMGLIRRLVTYKVESWLAVVCGSRTECPLLSGKMNKALEQ